MSNFSCPVITPAIREIHAEIQRLYPEASNRKTLTVEDVSRWVDIYSKDRGMPVDNVTKKDAPAIVNHIEKCLNMSGKSFKDVPYSIEYTYQGKKRTYTILKEEGTLNYKIFNEDGKVVFTEDSKDRRRVFANLAVQQGRAVIVEYKGKKYVVNNRNQIISVTTGDEMKWGEENGDRKEILRLSQTAFREKQKTNSVTTNSEVAGEGVEKNGGFTQVIIWNGYWTREQVAQQQDKIFLFGDNTNDRVSTHYVPSSTQAVIRGLPNAIGIDTKKNRGTGANSYFTDADFDQFKAQVDSALNAAKADGRTIVIPADGIGTGKAMLKEKAPKCFAYLQQELQKLQNSQAGNNSFPVGEQNVPKVGITSQLIAHLKDAGINVFDRTQMEKYLKEHPNALLQQALEEQWEMQDIKAKAIADGTFMKAPNGNSTNLNEKQWLQVRTTNFINWFGDWINDPANASKIVDENSEPKVVFHGSKTIISVFDSSKSDARNELSETIKATNFFSDDETVANFFTTTERQSLAIAIGRYLNDALESDIDRDPEEVWQWVADNVGKTKEYVQNFWMSLSFEDRMDAGDGIKIHDSDWEKQKYNVFLNMRNPLILDAKGENARDFIEKNKDILDANDEVIINNINETVGKKETATDYLVRKANNIKSATNNNGIFSTENDDIQMAIGRRKESINNSLSDNEKKNIRTLLKAINRTGTTLLDNGEGIMYLLDHTDKEGIETIKKNQDGFNCRLKFSTEGYTEEEIQTIKELIENGNIRNQKDFDKRSESYINKQRSDFSNRIDAEDRRTNGNNDSLDSRSSKGESRREQSYQNSQENFGTGFVRVYNNDGINGPRYIPINGDYILGLYMTPEGEIYGFVDKDGNMYLDETIIDASHPIHEYTHLWDRALAKNNPQLWKKGIELMKKTSLWNEIAEDANYGQKWKTMDMSADKLESLIASEVHARLVGENGAKLLDQIAKEKSGDSIVSKLKQWILDAWKALKATFSNWTQEEIDKLTLADFNHMTVRDFAEGINPNNIKQDSAALEQFKQEVDTLAGYYEGGGAVITDYLPTISKELEDKLVAYFWENKELSIEDYRELYRLMHPSASSTPSNAASNPLSASGVGFEATPTSANPIPTGTPASETPVAPEVEKPKPEKPISVAYESALKTNDSKVAQFERVFSPQQIKDRGAMISNIFSRIIDEALWDEMDAQLDIIESDTATEEEKNQAKLRLHQIKDPVTGRQMIAQEKGLPVILDEIKQEIQDNLDYAIQYNADEKRVQLWQNTLDYFTDLFNTQATLDIEEREGIRIVGLELQQTTAEDENDNQNDGDDEVGHVVSGSDGWSYQVRYTNPFDSLSRKVRGMLYEVERPGAERDDLGQVRYYPMGQIYASLLSYLAKNMQDSDAFVQIDHSNEGQDIWGNDINDVTYPNGYPTFPVLEQMSRVYPWVRQIINRLTDDYLNPEWNTNLRYPSTGGAMASQFYTNFRKAYIPYAKIQLGTGKFGVTPLNYQMEERAQFDKLEANYNNMMILTDHSIYDSNGKVNKNNAKWLQYKINSVIEKVRRGDYIEYPELMEQWQQNPEDTDFNQQDVDEFNAFVDDIKIILQSYGIDTTTEATVSYIMMEEGGPLYGMLQKLSYINDLIGKLDDSKLDSFNYILDLRNPYGENQWKHFFDGAGLITDQSYMQSFYDSASKKTKYSYSADNYLMKTFRGACMGTKEQRQAYINEHFGKFEWFRNQKTGEWRNKWLEFWYNYDGDQREIPYRNIDNVTEYGEDGAIIRQYSKWTPDDVWQVQSRSYDPESEAKTAFYLAPIFSDSPMSMTVKGPRMSMEELLYGYNDDNSMHHQGALVNLVNQELWRIQYVQQRAKAIEEGRVKAIANFDGKRGLQFCFLPELNSYTFEDGMSFLEKMLEMKERKATIQEIEAAQIQAIKAAIDSKMGEFIYENNEHYSPENPLKAEQYYNMVYANAAIIQMTTVDLAFYKNDTDFQKRFKEVYAGGIQLNTNSKYGKKTENIILLSDDIITSPSYDKIASIIDNSNTLTEADKNEIKASFTDINVADAQAIRSMHSFRSVLDMMGNWTDEMETALQHFKDGTWDRADFDIIYQTIKPFVYSVIERNDGNGGSILVPQQNKNSEICALMMYDLIANGLDSSPVYKALSRFMEDNLDADGNHLVDMAQFESAGKVGNQGVVNISFNPNKVVAIIEHGVVIKGEEFEFSTAYVDGKYLDNSVENAEANYRAIKEDLDKELAEGKTTQEEYNTVMSYLRPTEDEIVSMLEQAVLVTNPDGTKGINPEVVHTIPFDNYYQQQPTPEHHIDAEATFGSQARNIAVADLPDDFEMSVKVKGGTHTFKGKDAVIDFYYELLNENLIEDFFGKDSNKGLKGIFSSKEALRDAVTEIVRGNPKYGRDFAEALQIDDNGNFVLSPNSPTIFTLMQEIVTSFFKNRITKQTINGAALIQAAGIGLDKDLRMVFDKEGKLVGAECLMPLTSKRFFEPLLETKIIDGKEVKVLDPEKLKKAGLDKAIGYRIPTENKSSMMPLIIKDFTPLQNGSAIVLPAEITDVAGSDFDVDKMFIMLLSFYVQEYDKRAARKEFSRENPLYTASLEYLEKMGLAGSDEDAGLSEDEDRKFNEWFKANKESFRLEKPIIRKIEYDFSKSPKENGRKARNNMLIQMIFGILTSKEGSEQLFNPQGFKDFKRAAKINRILTDPNLREQLVQNTEGAAPGVLPSPDKIVGEFLSLLQEKYPNKYEAYKTAVLKMSAEQIQQMYIQAITAGNKEDAIDLLLNSSTKDLEKFISDYSAPESPVYPQTFAHSHAKNMAGANQIGIYAIQGSMDAKYQRADVRMRQEQQFTLNGRVIANVDVSEGGSRLKNVGQMIGASADNGKDPNLSDAGSTTKTAPIIGYMLRTGMSHLEAVLVMNQPHMQLSRYSAKNYKYWADILGKAPLATPVEVTTDMLIKGLISPFELTAAEDKAIAGLCYRVLMQHEAQEYLTQISRADSPNGSMQNSYAKARIQRYKVDLFNAKMGQDNFPFVRIKDAINNDAIDVTASEEVVREQLKGQRMAFLHGMYALGINSFNSLVNPYFFGAKQWFDDRIVKPILYNLNERLSDEKKEKIVNGIYISYITYMLSGSSLFGNEEGATMKQKRDYYLESFPSDYQQIIHDNEDIRELLGNILQVKNFGSRKRVILQDVGSLSKGQKQDVQRRFDALLYSDNPVARDLAKDLLIYSYFDNGLQFTHDSFSHLFTTKFLVSFPSYTETLNKLEEEITPEEEENFIHQFLLTYPEAAYNVSGIINSDNNVFDDGNTIRVDLNDKKLDKRMINEVMSPNPKSEGINVYPYIQYNGDVYVLDQNMFDQYPGTPIYHKLSKYATFPRLPLFNIEMSVAEMAKEFPVGEEQQEIPDVGTVDAPIAHNEGDGDPNVGPDSMYDEFAGRDDDFDFVDPADAEQAEEANPSDTFQSEGEAELKDPFC